VRARLRQLLVQIVALNWMSAFMFFLFLFPAALFELLAGSEEAKNLEFEGSFAYQIH
jgi:hypothetical protein